MEQFLNAKTEHFYSRLVHLAKYQISDLSVVGISPEELVHKAYIRLATSKNIDDIDEDSYFLSAFSVSIRFSLIDLIRKRNAVKRPPEISCSFDERYIGGAGYSDYRLSEGLNLLKSKNTKLYDIIYLKFFAGCTIDEISSMLDVSSSTVKRHLLSAKVILNMALR